MGTYPYYVVYLEERFSDKALDIEDFDTLEEAIEYVNQRLDLIDDEHFLSISMVSQSLEADNMKVEETIKEYGRHIQ